MSGRLPVLTGREVCAILKNVGFVEVPGRGKGDHIFLHRSDPATGNTMPGVGDVKRGTLRAIIRQAGMTVDEFLQLR